MYRKINDQLVMELTCIDLPLKTALNKHTSLLLFDSRLL